MVLFVPAENADFCGCVSSNYVKGNILTGEDELWVTDFCWSLTAAMYTSTVNRHYLLGVCLLIAEGTVLLYNGYMLHVFVFVCVCVCVCEIGFCILNYMSWNCPDFTHCTLNFIKLLNFVNKKAQYLISVLKRPLCTRAPCTWHDALTPEDSQSHIKVIMSFNSTYYVPRLCHPPDCDCQRP